MRNPMIDDIKSSVEKGLETASKLGASAAKIGFQHVESLGCGFESGRLKHTDGSENLAYSIVVHANGRKGSASGNRLEEIDSLIGRATTLASIGSVAHFTDYPAPGKVTEVKTHSDRTLTLSREKMIEACQVMADSLKAYNPDLDIECSADRTESESLLVTSGGVCHSNINTHWNLWAVAVRTQGTDIMMVYDSRNWCDLNDFFDPNIIASRIITHLKRSERMVDPPTGKVTAYLPPETLKRLLGPIFMGTSGRNVAKGESPLVGRLNEKVLADCLTIIDNPHYDYSGGACSIDGDGVPTIKQEIFRNGNLQRYLYDLDSAGLAGEQPTGNSGCYPHCIMVTPGSRPSDELIASISDGLYIENLIGFGQSNVINGDFSCNLALGYRIEKGEITGRVKDTMIAGNLYDLLGGNVELSSDLDHEGRFPHAVVEGLSVSTK
jgi:PmbA protein